MDRMEVCMNSSRAFQSMSGFYGTDTDCRVLFFRIEFSHVHQERVMEAALEYYRFVNAFYHDEFVSLWQLEKEGKFCSPRKFEAAIKDLNETPGMVVESNAISSGIYNKSQLRNYLKSHSRNQFDARPFSLGYDRYFDKYIRPAIGDPDKLKSAVFALFSESGKTPIDKYEGADSVGIFHSMPDCLGSTYAHGFISFTIAVGCLLGNVDQTAEIFETEMRRLCIVLGLAGGRTGITSFPMHITTEPYPYWKYFGSRKLHTSDPLIPEEHPSNWEKVSYCWGCEWSNVISPVARRRLSPEPLDKGLKSFIEVEELPSNGLAVKLKRDLSTVDVNDLMKVKRFLYPALYPGKTGIPIEYLSPMCPTIALRHHWERIPIFYDEIRIENGYIIFEKPESTCRTMGQGTVPCPTFN